MRKNLSGDVTEEMMKKKNPNNDYSPHFWDSITSFLKNPLLANLNDLSEAMKKEKLDSNGLEKKLNSHIKDKTISFINENPVDVWDLFYQIVDGFDTPAISKEKADKLKSISMFLKTACGLFCAHKVKFHIFDLAKNQKVYPILFRNI